MVLLENDPVQKEISLKKEMPSVSINDSSAWLKGVELLDAMMIGVEGFCTMIEKSSKFSPIYTRIDCRNTIIAFFQKDWKAILA